MADGVRKGIHPYTETDIGLFHPEKIVCTNGAVPVFPQSGYQRQQALVDAACGFVQYGIVDMHAQRFTDHQVAGTSFFTKHFYLQDAAFDPDFAFPDHRRSNQGGGLGSKSRLYKFGDFLWIIAARQADLLHHRIIDDIDDYFRNFQHIMPGMLRAVVPHPSGWRKDQDRRSSGEKIEEAERTQVHLAGAIDRAGKADGPRRYRSLQITLSFDRGKRFQIDGHIFFPSSNEKSLSSLTRVLFRMPSPSTSISTTSFSRSHCSV